MRHEIKYYVDRLAVVLADNNAFISPYRAYTDTGHDIAVSVNMAFSPAYIDGPRQCQLDVALLGADTDDLDAATQAVVDDLHDHAGQTSTVSIIRTEFDTSSVTLEEGDIWLYGLSFAVTYSYPGD